MTQPPPPGSSFAALVLERGAPDVDTELARLAATPTTDPEVLAELAAWRHEVCAHRFLVLLEREAEFDLSLLDTEEELHMHVLQTLLTAETSSWTTTTSPPVEQFLAGILLDCACPAGSA